jgi:hypothetical protein
MLQRRQHADLTAQQGIQPRVIICKGPGRHFCQRLRSLSLQKFSPAESILYLCLEQGVTRHSYHIQPGVLLHHIQDVWHRVCEGAGTQNWTQQDDFTNVQKADQKVGGTSSTPTHVGRTAVAAVSEAAATSSCRTGNCPAFRGSSMRASAVSRL